MGLEAFISYARLNNHEKWVTNFRNKLIPLLRESLGTNVNVFFDDHSVEPNIEFDSAILESVKSADVFIAVVSDAYFRSDWCKLECEAFRVKARKTKVMIVRYDELGFDEIQKFFPKNLGFKFFGNGGIPLDSESDPYRREVYKLRDTIKRELRSAREFSRSLSVPSTPGEKDEVPASAVDALIGVLRTHMQSSRVPVAIANSLLRHSIVPDPSQLSEDPVESVVRGLLRDPIATSNTTPALLIFLVLLHKLIPVGEPLAEALQSWFTRYGEPAGYDYTAIAGQPETRIPDPIPHFFWMDIRWPDSIIGQPPQKGVAQLRVGDLSFPIAGKAESACRLKQVSELSRAAKRDVQNRVPLNHIGLTVPIDELHCPWETDAWGPVDALIDPPITVRVAGEVAQERQCPEVIQRQHLRYFSGDDPFSVHVQDHGIFATGKLDSSEATPCSTVRLLIRSATIGVWTRGCEESDEDEEQLHSTLVGKRYFEIPAAVHTRRNGSTSNNFWRRTVLYFDPNLPDLEMEQSTTDNDLFGVNNQLN